MSPIHIKESVDRVINLIETYLIGTNITPEDFNKHFLTDGTDEYNHDMEFERYWIAEQIEIDRDEGLNREEDI